MKKLVFAAVAAIALTASVSFVSCDKKPAVNADTVAVDTTAAVENDTVAPVDVDSLGGDSATVVAED